MPVRPGAIEYCVADVRASRTAPAASAYFIGLFHAVLLRNSGRKFIIEKSAALKGLARKPRYAFIRYVDAGICCYPICGAAACPASGRPVAIERATASAR